MNDSTAASADATRRRRTLAALATSLVALGVGEELWQSYLPAYITALGGTGLAVGLFGSCRDLLDGLYQLPGGWISDRFGSRQAVRLFTAAAVLGYAAYALAWDWRIVFVGLAGTMAWKAGAFPATFAVIGDVLPPGKRVAGFTLQSLAVRVPRVVSAPIGGLLVGQLGLLNGLRTGMVASVVLGLTALLVQQRGFERTTPARAGNAVRVRLAPALPPPLVRLLIADCLVRIGEAIAASFLVLYVTSELDVPLPLFGTLYAIQQAVAIALYLPAARLVARVGPRVLVAASFAFFAAFPLAIVWARGLVGLVCAFAIGGFKEIGEPARKSSIVDLCRSESRGRDVGAYYAVRNLLVVPAGVAGGFLWQHSPALVLEAAGAVSAAGLLVFVLFTPPGEWRLGAWASRPAVTARDDRLTSLR